MPSYSISHVVSSLASLSTSRVMRGQTSDTTPLDGAFNLNQRSPAVRHIILTGDVGGVRELPPEIWDTLNLTQLQYRSTYACTVVQSVVGSFSCGISSTAVCSKVIAQTLPFPLNSVAGPLGTISPKASIAFCTTAVVGLWPPRRSKDTTTVVSRFLTPESSLKL